MQIWYPFCVPAVKRDRVETCIDAVTCIQTDAENRRVNPIEDMLKFVFEFDVPPAWAWILAARPNSSVAILAIVRNLSAKAAVRS
jgi:hypothetical protein